MKLIEKARGIFAASVFVAVGATSSAFAATYDIMWTGGGGYTMTGSFSFDDSLLGTGAIDETQIDELEIEIFLNGISQGARSLVDDGLGTTASTFNFNFDSTSEEFIVGGRSTGTSGQNWFTTSGGVSCDTIGFSSGSGAQGVCLGGSIVIDSFVDINVAVDEGRLTATRVPAPIPVPATGALLIGGLGILAFARRRKAA